MFAPPGPFEMYAPPGPFEMYAPPGPFEMQKHIIRTQNSKGRRLENCIFLLTHHGQQGKSSNEHV
jgi:hypothetical protein